jgi:hypothetical protein
MNIITFFYIFSQSSNSLTHQKARIAFFCGHREETSRLVYFGRRFGRVPTIAVALLRVCCCMLIALNYYAVIAT